MQGNRKRSFFENRNELHGGSLFRTLNSSSTSYVVGGELPGREASNFCDFWNLTPYFSPFWLSQTFVFIDVLNKDNYIANLCPNMINFDALDFSECRSEEVISFFWRSVYIYK